MPTLRSKEMQQKYREYKKTHPLQAGCPLCAKAVIKKFKYWNVLENLFPYDIIATKHHMIVPVRHITESELTREETNELVTIKKEYIDGAYDYIIEATTKNKSIPEHFHLHVVVGNN